MQRNVAQQRVFFCCFRLMTLVIEHQQIGFENGKLKGSVEVALHVALSSWLVQVMQLAPVANSWLLIGFRLGSNRRTPPILPPLFCCEGIKRINCPIELRLSRLERSKSQKLCSWSDLSPHIGLHATPLGKFGGVTARLAHETRLGSFGIAPHRRLLHPNFGADATVSRPFSL